MKQIHPLRPFVYLLFIIVIALAVMIITSSRQPAAILAGNQRTASLTGIVTVVWQDSFSDKESSHTIYVVDDQGRHHQVELSPAALQSAGGISNLYRQRVNVQGEWLHGEKSGLEDILLVQEISVVSAAEGEMGGNAFAVSGSQPWLTVICKFAGNASEPRPLSYFKEMYQNSYPRLDHYWRELSDGQIDLVGSTAVGWYNLPFPEAYYIADNNGDGSPDRLDQLAEDCTSLAEPHVNFANFKGINMMFNSDESDSNWGGSMYLELDGVGKVWAVTWIWSHGYLIGSGQNQLFIIEHEMGHGFGLPHSGVKYTYDNIWDVMSDGIYWYPPHTNYANVGVHTNAYHKDMLGWIPEGRRYAVSAAEKVTLTITRSARPGRDGYQIVTIPAKRGGGVYYTVEARMWQGYDADLFGEGIIIHRVDRSDPVESRAVDMDNDSYTYADQLWTVGETFHDQADGVTISIDKKFATEFEVTISSGSAPKPPGKVENPVYLPIVSGRSV